jgi:hypothetical protein
MLTVVSSSTGTATVNVGSLTIPDASSNDGILVIKTLKEALAAAVQCTKVKGKDCNLIVVSFLTQQKSSGARLLGGSSSVINLWEIIFVITQTDTCDPVTEDCSGMPDTPTAAEEVRALEKALKSETKIKGDFDTLLAAGIQEAIDAGSFADVAFANAFLELVEEKSAFVYQVAFEGSAAPTATKSDTKGLYAVVFFGCFLGAVLSGCFVSKFLAAGAKKRAGVKDPSDDNL